MLLSPSLARYNVSSAGGREDCLTSHRCDHSGNIGNPKAKAAWLLPSLQTSVEVCFLIPLAKEDSSDYDTRRHGVFQLQSC